MTAELVSIGAEILSLKQKLGESSEGSVAERICWYCRKWGNNPNCSDVRKLAKQFLNEIQNK